MLGTAGWFIIGVFVGGLFGFIVSAVLFADPYDD